MTSYWSETYASTAEPSLLRISDKKDNKGDLTSRGRKRKTWLGINIYNKNCAITAPFSSQPRDMGLSYNSKPSDMDRGLWHLSKLPTHSQQSG